MGIDIGTKIRKIREIKDLTQANMADALGCSQSYYARIENNNVDLSLSKLEEIATVLNITPQHLLSFDGANYIQSVMHSQVGSGQYINHQNSMFQKQLDQQQEQIQQLSENVAFLRKLIEQKLT